MPYSNCLSIEQALYFDLFDDIKYEWLKEVLDPKREDECDFEVEIEDIPNPNDENTEYYKTTQFTFDLRMSKTKPSYNANGYTSEYITKTFVVKKTYLYNSPFGISLGSNYEDTDDEEEEEEAELKCPHPKVDEEDNLCHDCFHKTCEKGECYCEDCDKPKECTIGDEVCPAL